MGRTIPYFGIALGMEKEEWKPFRNKLGKSQHEGVREYEVFSAEDAANGVYFIMTLW
jgi:hypothetical protein